MGLREFFKKAPVTPGKEIVTPVGNTKLFVLDGLVYNPDKITLDVYKKISKHYQVKAAISTIGYSIQQIDWFIQSDDKLVAEFVEHSIEKIWNSLIRSSTKALKYGFSPNVKVFELEMFKGKEYINYKKIKDLDPKDCQVKVDKFGNFDGFYYRKGAFTNEGKDYVDPKYAFWYVCNMENGNHYGESQLTYIYKPWFRSEKVHDFANRYYERFGEPLVVGRAPSGSTIQLPDGKKINSQEAMQIVISEIRSHSSAQLPSNRDEKGNYEYVLEYLESQMRGFDFETYLSRLDKEIAVGLLFPQLMLGGEKGGSYALGGSQLQSFYTNLMGMMDNISDYINAYMIPQLVEYNFGVGKSANFSYQPLTVDAKKDIQEMIMQLVKDGKVMPDVAQIEARSGVKLQETTPPVKSGAVSAKTNKVVKKV